MEDRGVAQRHLTPFEPAVEALERAAVLDHPAKLVGKQIRSAIPDGPVKDAISGTWLGHALHPLLTDVVVGTFLSATLLDLLSRDADRASERLIELGLAATPPTALAGVNDWADAEPADHRVRRAGVAHAAGNVVAAALYAASLAARRGGARRLGRVLGLGGAAALATSAYLGGHLTFSRGVGPNQTVYDLGPTEWMPVEAGELREGEPTRLIAADTPVLAVRRGERILAIHDRCSHRGCSLSEGELHGDEIRCACHGSRFDLRDGALRGGPATAAQPAFEVREAAGRIEVRLAATG